MLLASLTLAMTTAGAWGALVGLWGPMGGLPEASSSHLLKEQESMEAGPVLRSPALVPPLGRPSDDGQFSTHLPRSWLPGLRVPTGTPSWQNLLLTLTNSLQGLHSLGMCLGGLGCGLE